ncbi:MAG: hypothetical protein Q9213_008120, partial [Squamulea squamosa]
MVFTSPQWVPNLPFDPPDSVPICDFMLKEQYGRRALNDSRLPFTCGLTGVEYSAHEVKDRVYKLAKALSKYLEWNPNQGTEWDKVAGIFSVNTIHRLSGLSSPANAAYSKAELQYQLQSSGSKALFTCLPLLPIALEAASNCNIPRSKVFLLQVPKEVSGSQNPPEDIKTVEQLIQEGASLPDLEDLRWEKGQGARQTAFLCYSSGTSGLPMSTYESPFREPLKQTGAQYGGTEVALGLLPQSHIYSLVVICHSTTYRGDQVINLPKFELQSYLEAIQRFKINTLYLVPPIIITMVKNKSKCDQYNLESVQGIFTGAAPLGEETAAEFQEQYPTWQIRQGYGLTETSTVCCATAPNDIWLGSSGSFLPMIEARILSVEGTEITGYDQPGELVIKSPSVVLGYLNNDEANKETFQEGWMRTGDVAVIKKSPKGNEHCFIVDRIKELIKVKVQVISPDFPSGVVLNSPVVYYWEKKGQLLTIIQGMQVAPAELEAHLLSYPAVADCAVISVPDEAAGELPKAYIVKSASVGLEENDGMLVRRIKKHVENHKAKHKWLRGGVAFVPQIPKSPSGKILRRLLKEKDKEARRQQGPKLQLHIYLYAGLSLVASPIVFLPPNPTDRMETPSDNHHDGLSDDDALLDPSEAAEIVADDPDNPMHSDDEDDGQNDAQEEIQLQNDSIAYFDLHSDSIFCIASHPIDATIIATGGGDDTTYVFSIHTPSPLLPPSYETNPTTTRSAVQTIANIQGHTDSVNALMYTSGRGNYLVTGGLDGRVRVHCASTVTQVYSLLASVQEVQEVNFLVPCPHPSYPDTFALGANDGSVWIYAIEPQGQETNLQVLQAYYLHTESCTAGAWTPDGRLLTTISEDGSFNLWDPFGEAAAAGITGSSSGQAVVGLTAADQRFAVEDGLFSVAVSPTGAFAAVGGAHGMIRIVGLPRLNNTSSSSTQSATKSLKGRGANNKSSDWGKQTSTSTDAGGSQSGQILSSLQIQSDSIETLAFSPYHSLLAAGSVDGSIAIFDSAHRFAVRRHIKEAHDG